MISSPKGPKHSLVSESIGRGVMIKLKSENQTPGSGSVWFPGKKPEGLMVVPLSARAQEIAKSREELLGLLLDLPESDYELSLTDLVEKELVAASGTTPAKNSAEVEETNLTSLDKDRTKRHRRSSISSSDGVLLNMYVPTTITMSPTGSRMCSSQRATIDGNKRDREHSSSLSCWPAICYKGRGKSRRT